MTERAEYTVEPDHRLSTHAGTVFGQHVSDADRKPRVYRWLVLRDGRVVVWFRTRREARAYVERVTGVVRS